MAGVLEFVPLFLARLSLPSRHPILIHAEPVSTTSRISFLPPGGDELLTIRKEVRADTSNPFQEERFESNIDQRTGRPSTRPINNLPDLIDDVSSRKLAPLDYSSRFPPPRFSTCWVAIRLVSK